MMPPGLYCPTHHRSLMWGCIECKRSDEDEELLHSVYDILSDFWNQPDPLVRMDIVMRAQRRIESMF